MKYFKLLFFVLVIVLASCNQTSRPNSSVTANIENIGWVIGNIPANFWTGGSGPSAVIYLGVYFEDPKLKLSDLKQVTISNSLSPDYSWSYTGSELESRFYTSPSTKKSALSFPNLWTTNIANNGSVIYLGTYVIDVKLKNGKTATKKLVTPAPGSLKPDGYSYTYSPEDFPLNTVGVFSNYVALPKRATIQSAIANSINDTINIEFSVEDEKIYSGWVWFIDRDGNYLGYVGNFKDYTTGANHNNLNDGSGLKTDGQTNLLNLNLSDINTFEDVAAITLGEIARILIVLTDGKQYAGTDSTYDAYSYSIASVTQQ